MSGKRKIAILGGGPAGLTAAYGLTSSRELRDRYDVTVYQVGWRAGGKCASGRAGPTHRIEQNGTHYLFGCYDNGFAMLKTVYDELQRDGIADFGTFEQAFLPRDLLALKQFFRGKWNVWPIQLPTNRIDPGSRPGFLRGIDYVSMGVQFVFALVLPRRLYLALRPPAAFGPPRPGWLVAVYAILRPLWSAVAWLVAALLTVFAKLLVGLLRVLGDDGLEGIVDFFRAWRAINRLLLRRLAGRFLLVNRLFATIDFQCTVMVGIIRDDVLGERGFGGIERIEFRDWLRAHGACEETLYAPFVATWYDAVAACIDGDPNRGNLSAGVSLMSIAKSMLSYKGHFAYQMRAESGDTLVAPLFECLRRRGVKMRFFHRVRDVIPGEGHEIDEILVERQVDLKSGDPDSYEPFITVKGLKVWPNEPLWDQIDQEKPEKTVDFESFYTTWRGKEVTLKKGVDFDVAILAIPPGAFPTYCSKILERSEPWRDQVQKVPTVETQSIRLWFRPTLRELGWTLGPPVLSAYARPFSTWEDNSQLVDVETWPEDDRPGAMATLFGPLPCKPTSPGPEDAEYPARRLATAKRNALRFMEEQTGSLWPGVTSLMDPLCVDWPKLIDLDNGVGAERMEAQYVRANCGPIERYTMAAADTAQYRLATDETGFSNLYLAGDWIQNHFLIGSVEGAIMAGLQASQAISGHPEEIYGEIPSL